MYIFISLFGTFRWYMTEKLLEADANYLTMNVVNSNTCKSLAVGLYAEYKEVLCVITFQRNKLFFLFRKNAALGDEVRKI